MFDHDWQDGRVHGTVKSWQEWDVDKTNTEISTEYLYKEDDLLPCQGTHLLL